MSTGKYSVNEKTPREDPAAPIPHFPSEYKSDIKDELAGVEEDAGSLEEEELEESIRLVPKIVRELVSMDDDPTLPTVTFR
jgi:hypothetical protein